MTDSESLLDIFDGALETGGFAIRSPSGFLAGVPEIAAATRRATQRLAAAEVGPGEVVLYQGPQGIEPFILFWAAMRRGAVFAPVDHEWPDYLVERATAALAPRVTVSTGDRAGLYRRLFPQARHVSVAAADGDGEWTAWLGEAGEPPDPGPPAPVGESAPAAYLFTSGSTGVPKAVVLSRAALAQGGRITVDSLCWDAGDALVNAPAPHGMSGLRNAFVAAPLAHLQLNLVASGPRPCVFELLETLRRAPCNRLVVSPILIRQLLLLGRRIAPATFTGVKAVYCTGAPLNGADVEAFHARFGIPLVNYYGLTESGGICVAQRLTDWRPEDRSLGFAAGAELRLLLQDGGWAGAGVGELWVRSPQLMSGYLGQPERTAERLQDGWLRTGDLVSIAPDGRCSLRGRIDGFLKCSSTDRVAPEEIEAVLEAHPDVAEAAALGVPSELEGEQIMALVAPRTIEPISALELAAFARERLGPARTPRIQFVDRLPRQTSGKLARKELAALVRAERAASPA